jgi:hypothetical protein
VKPEQRQKFLIVLVIVVGGLLVGERFIFTPLTNWWGTRSTSITNLRSQVSDGNRLIKSEKFLRGQWDNMRTNTLPNSSEAEQQMLKAVDGWQRSSGAAINNQAPQWKTDADDYSTLNWHIDASGDIRTLVRLLYLIEGDPLALKLDSVALSARDNSGQVMQLSLQISGLSLLPTKKP